MSDTPETDALRETIDSGGGVEAEMTSLAAKLERERDEAFGALAAQDKKMEVAGKQCGIPFEVFGCDWPDRVAEELIAVAKERDEAREELQEWIDGAYAAEHPCPDEIHCTCVPLLLSKIAALREERDEARAERDEWIARFRADEQLIKEAMEKHE